MRQTIRHLLAVVALLCAAINIQPAAAEVPLGGFIPFVGIGLTRSFKPDSNDTFFMADPRSTYFGTPMGPNGNTANPYFDVALLDTGAATHILTQAAAATNAFGIRVPFSGEPDGFGGTNIQPIFGANGQIDLTITDPLGVFAAGMSQRTSNGGPLTMNTAAMRGQTSVAILEAPASWELPNIIGLPMAAQHGIVIRNSQPQVFAFNNGTTTRTLRTPDISLIPLGTGGQQGIARRTNLRLEPSSSFIAGPVYIQNLDITTFKFTENPLSPTVVDSGGLYLDVDITNDGNSLQDKRILFDTGADLTVFSEVFAASLGLDILLKTPDFHLEVEGAGGLASGVPGYYVEQLKIDAVGGPIILNHVPVAVLDVPNPNSPANVIDAILGMHLFADRDLVIDASPAAAGSGVPPRLYISDPITESHAWSAPGTTGTWATAANWSAAGTPGTLWVTTVKNTTASDKSAVVAANSQVYQVAVSATSTGRMIVDIQSGATLTTFGETRIDNGGTVVIQAGGKLDSQTVNIYGGTLAGKGSIFVGSGPVNGVVRNLAGQIAPGTLADPFGKLTITGDLSNLDQGKLSFDLGGLTPISQYDQISVDRSAFLGGTLEVSLNGFSPSVNDSFTLITAGKSVVGQFQLLMLPSSFTWNVAYNASNVVLTVTGIGTPGDFNNDGKVDGADYVVWRKTGGTPQQYQDWRSHFGAGPGSGGSIGGNAVPEPSTCLLAMLITCGLTLTRPARSAA